jgi:hypothetical protein
LFSVLYRNKDTIPHAIQEISDSSGIVSDLSDIFQNSRLLALYDAHIYPYRYLPTANLTPLVVTTLFSVFTDLIATLIITASCVANQPMNSTKMRLSVVVFLVSGVIDIVAFAPTPIMVGATS